MTTLRNERYQAYLVAGDRVVRSEQVFLLLASRNCLPRGMLFRLYKDHGKLYALVLLHRM
jgi:hypothetical protein